MTLSESQLCGGKSLALLILGPVAFSESVQPSPWEKCVCMGVYGTALFVGKMLAKVLHYRKRDCVSCASCAD